MLLILLVLPVLPVLLLVLLLVPEASGAETMVRRLEWVKKCQQQSCPLGEHRGQGI